MSILNLSHLNVSYQSKHVIKDLNLQVNKGDIVAVFGPSGCGKSTVLKSIAGLLDNVSGKIKIAGNMVNSGEILVPAEQRHIGLIFQDYALFPHLNVRENIGFGLSDLTKKDRQHRVDEMLTLIKMEEYAHAYPHELSGGQQQRIAIVRALACKPSLLLFDEAFSNIDPQFRFELIADIRALLKTQNIAALFVTHNQDEAFAFCDRIAVLNNGKIEQMDTAERLFNYPSTRFIAEFLGEGLWLKATVKSENTLSSSLGDISYCGEISIADLHGETVDIYLRPHQLKLLPSQDSQIIVENERFVGEFYETTLTWLNQTVKVKTVDSFINKPVVIKVDMSVTSFFHTECDLAKAI